MGKKHQNKSTASGFIQNKEGSSVSALSKKSANKLSPQKRNEVNQLVDKLLKGKSLKVM